MFPNSISYPLVYLHGDQDEMMKQVVMHTSKNSLPQEIQSLKVSLCEVSHK